MAFPLTGAPWAAGLGGACLQVQLDDIVAGECPLTGAVMIDSITAPLLDPAEEKAERASWEI